MEDFLILVLLTTAWIACVPDAEGVLVHFRLGTVVFWFLLRHLFGEA
jgi:hypothetical protein